MQTVNIYTHSTIKSPGKRDGVGIFVMQLDGAGESGTRKQILPLRGYTQQSAELELLRRSIERLKTQVNLRIFTDNASVAAAFTNGWVRRWEKSDWKTSKGSAVTNADMWKDVLKWIRGIGMLEDAIEWHVQESHAFRELMRWEAANKLAEMRRKS